MPDTCVSFIRLAREDLVTDLEGGREREMERERVRVRERESGWVDGWSTSQIHQERPWSHPVCSAIGWQLQRVRSRHVSASSEYYTRVRITRVFHVSLLMH